MSAGSDPVVIVSAARTVIGEWPADLARRRSCGPGRVAGGTRGPQRTRGPKPLLPGSRAPSPGEGHSFPRALIGSPGRTTRPQSLPLAGGEKCSLPMLLRGLLRGAAVSALGSRGRGRWVVGSRAVAGIWRVRRGLLRTASFPRVL